VLHGVLRRSPLYSGRHGSLGSTTESGEAAGAPAAVAEGQQQNGGATSGRSMVDRMPGQLRDKARDSHHPVDILTRNAIPASFGLEQAGVLMETDKTKWVILVATAGLLVNSDCDVRSTCFAVGGIGTAVLGKVCRVVLSEQSLLNPSLVKRAGVFLQVLQRVTTTPANGRNERANGMPSTHALSLFYIASYFSTGWLLKCATTIQNVADKRQNTAHGGVSHASPLLAVGAVAEVMSLATASATVILVSGALAYRRAQVGQHSTKEVTYGIALGCLCGASWKLTAGAELCLNHLSAWMFLHGFHNKIDAVRSCRASVRGLIARF
jgi:hypothetical protein